MPGRRARGGADDREEGGGLTASAAHPSGHPPRAAGQAAVVLQEPAAAGAGRPAVEELRQWQLDRTRRPGLANGCPLVQGAVTGNAGRRRTQSLSTPSRLIGRRQGFKLAARVDARCTSCTVAQLWLENGSRGRVCCNAQALRRTRVSPTPAHNYYTRPLRRSVWEGRGGQQHFFAHRVRRGE